MALMQITVIPIGTGSPSVGDYIADIELFLRDKGVEHTMNDMGTVIYGTARELLQLAHEVHRLPFTKGAERVITNITMDERLDRDIQIGDKQQSIIRKLRKADRS